MRWPKRSSGSRGYRKKYQNAMHTPVQISAEINNSFGCGKKEANKGTLLEWHGRHGRADVSNLDERRTMGEGPLARNRDMTGSMRRALSATACKSRHGHQRCER